MSFTRGCCLTGISGDPSVKASEEDVSPACVAALVKVFLPYFPPYFKPPTPLPDSSNFGRAVLGCDVVGVYEARGVHRHP